MTSAGGSVISDDSGPGFLMDPYLDWTKREGIPVVEGFGLDLLAVETKPWARLGVDGAFAHLAGRGDFTSVFVIDLPPGGKTEPQSHIFEEVVYVLSGHGSTTVEAADGRVHSFEWRPKSLFALPLNAAYRHFNGSGRERARLASVNNLPLVLNLFHNETFVFNNDFHFAERQGKEQYFSGEGDFIPRRPGRHTWETNFVPSVSEFELKRWNARGAGGSNMMFALADGTMHAHTSEMPVGTYKKAHQHGPDFHVFCVHGTGYSLLWYEGDEEMERVDWRHGVVFTPPDQMFHQHFNTGADPARYLALALGGIRYPMTEAKFRIFRGMDVSVKKGGAQIEYEDQDPRVHRIFLEELRKNGVKSRMGQFVDETTPAARKS